MESKWGGGDSKLNEPYLYHHGVKGMKWGVRKDRGSGGNTRRQTRKAKRVLRRRLKWANQTIKLNSDEVKKNNEALKTGKYRGSFGKGELTSKGKKFFEQRNNALKKTIPELIKARDKIAKLDPTKMNADQIIKTVDKINNERYQKTRKHWQY